MSASTARQQFHLPPLSLSDFVVHYRNADFHVHQFVLYHHSAYFRTYFQTLQPLAQVVTGKKRKRCTVDLSSSDEDSRKCSHLPLVRCIDVPDQCGIALPTIDARDVFLLFLQHLYFSSTLHCPPFVPKPELRAALTDSTRACIVFPTSPTTKEGLVEYNAPGSDGFLLWYPSLLSLFHYFDCQQAMKRCEAVIVERVSSGHLDAWFWLPLAVRYSLKEAEAKCIEVAVRDKRFRADDAAYKEELQHLTVETLHRLLEAAIRK
jgi:hypothetical protein